MATPSGGSTRRELLRVGSLLAVGTAGCASPVAAPAASPHGPHQFDVATRDRARSVGERHRSAVVVLQPPGSATSGTAWFLAGGHLLTNAHVIDELGGGVIEGHTLDGATFDVTLEHRVDRPDLASLSGAIDPPASLEPGRVAELEPGQPLVQIGHTRFGYWSISLGRYRRRHRFPDRTWLLSDLPVTLGNSGSPVLTLDGRVVGMTFGAVPKAGTGPSTAPTPGPVTVYDTYPRRKIEFGGHLAIETIERYVNQWTQSDERTASGLRLPLG